MSGRVADTNDIALARAATELADVERHIGWARVEKVADVLARYFFHGSLERVGRKSGARSIRRLAAHPSCPLSKTRLNELLAAYEVARSEPLVRASQLTPSHVAVVARLAPQERRALLESAVRERPSVRELKLRVRAMRKNQGDRRGRPPTFPAEKAVTRLENAEIALEQAVQHLSEADSLKHMGPRIALLLDRVHDLVERADALVERQRRGALRRTSPNKPLELTA